MASAKPDFALPPQTVLHAHYLLGDTLGGGALGITYRAVQLDAPARGRVVAVKEFFPRALAVRAADGSVQPMPKGAADFALYCAQRRTARRLCPCWICSSRTARRMW